MKAALYARISKKVSKQDTENQLLQLREYCARQGWTVVEFVERETASGKVERDEFHRLFDEASKRMFDVVVVWALDRFTREGIGETFEYLKRLKGFGVQFESFTEPQFRTTGPFGETFAELMLALAAWFAKQERLRISERTKAGLERVRKSGVQLGRRRRIFDRSKARAMKARGLSIREISAKLHVPRSTVHEALQA